MIQELPKHSFSKTLRSAVLVGLSSVLGLGAGLALAQEDDPGLLNTVLDIDALYSPLSSEPVHGQTAISLLAELESKHYSAVDIDDNFSSTVFDSFLDALDGSKLYFMKEDIDRLSAYRYTLDDTLLDGSIEPGFEMYNIYYKRILERMIYAVNRIENDIPAMDFSLEESITLDREDAPYAESIAELDEIWRLRIKNSVLSLKLAGDTDEEIMDKLSKRYRNQLSQILKTNGKDVFQAYLANVAIAVDPHTSYFSPRDSENFNMGLSLSLQGIGAQLTTDEEYTKVVELIKGGPAEIGEELQQGDRIIGIGQGVDGDIQDVVGMRLDDVVAQIRGEKGTVVRLSVIPVDSVSETNATVVSITRDTVKLEDQSAKKEVIELSYNGDDYKIGVVDLPTFYFDFEAAARGDQDFKSSTRDVRVLLEELEEEGVDAVVVDLRNNGGGSLSEANQLVGLFIETGPTVQIRYSGLRNGFTRSFGDNDPEMAYAGPLAVLVNRTSASASEIFAGAIQDYERGIVLGGQTFGKGTVQEIIPMDYGQVKLTRSKFYRISGESTQHRGVVPDISFPDFYDAYEDIGESSLDGALPWDTVRPVEYRHYLAIQEVLPQLQQLHEERAESSADFIYLENQIERTRELRGREEISLNELVVKTEREESRRREFDAENMRRMMKGLPLRDWVDADAEEDEEEVEISANDDVSLVDNSDDEALEDEVEEEKDPLLLESGRVLVDFIALNRGNANSISDTSSRQRPAR
ncbi:MAG: carboxy terminal-processing peptidase [Gammaproteobacteria bacterium]|jgi:carboxyl-terminal processing protease|nr:carboxy terminal-processing peptidase [Gammaproteobacteria bacterium]MBT3858833.1 carboxy terminal-processing peptidase [Gammaproteobacteria bacterium]MBT3986184.1 carboxy terminal-processing peptidase [Gammaproteobacteria bacterium]MBT4257036.1 carboxy terminal-processing peptidase [Gammaproteobacteria bacterium]MBT4581350.1 carboxy terminal-processing peptidase [Gammaproteobacteria bacterium]